MDAKQLRDLIIIPTLKFLELYSESAVNLLLGTIAQESEMGEYIRQLGFDCRSGGAFGICQCEMKTHEDVLAWLKSNKSSIYNKVLLLMTQTPWLTNSQQLEGNLFYAVAIARCLYLSIAEPLPAADDINAMAVYWKKYYNRGGKGTIEQFEENYEKHVLSL